MDQFGTTSLSTGINLSCPECSKQIPLNAENRKKINDTGSRAGSDGRLAPNLESPMCNHSFFLEDAFLAHLNKLDHGFWGGVPLTIGGFTLSEGISIQPGDFRQINVNRQNSEIESLGTPYYHLIQLGGQIVPGDIQCIQVVRQTNDGNSEIHVHNGVNESNKGCIVNIPYAGDDKILVTCIPQGSGGTLPDQVKMNIAYTIRFMNIEDPPWVKLLRKASVAAKRGEFTSAIPLMTAAVDNHLHRQIYQTGRNQGLSPNNIEDEYLSDDYRPSKSWSDLVTDGITELTNVHMPESPDYGSIYREYGDEVRNKRNNEIIHVDLGGNVANLSPDDTVKIFDKTIDMITGTFEICYNSRSG
jgi:hypothetical protein